MCYVYSSASRGMMNLYILFSTTPLDLVYFAKYLKKKIKLSCGAFNHMQYNIENVFVKYIFDIDFSIRNVCIYNVNSKKTNNR